MRSELNPRSIPAIVSTLRNGIRMALVEWELGVPSGKSERNETKTY